MQKGVFYMVKGHVLFCGYESFLQKGAARGGARAFLWVVFGWLWIFLLLLLRFLNEVRLSSDGGI